MIAAYRKTDKLFEKFDSGVISMCIETTAYLYERIFLRNKVQWNSLKRHI